jgi:hypothetical protein
LLAFLLAMAAAASSLQAAALPLSYVLPPRAAARALHPLLRVVRVHRRASCGCGGARPYSMGLQQGMECALQS